MIYLNGFYNYQWKKGSHLKGIKCKNLSEDVQKGGVDI